MDQPGEGKQPLPQRQCNCFCTQPQPQPPSPWLWVPTCQISSYFIILFISLRHPDVTSVWDWGVGGARLRAAALYN